MATCPQYFQFGTSSGTCASCLFVRTCSREQLNNQTIASWHAKHRPPPVEDPYVNERRPTKRAS